MFVFRRRLKPVLLATGLTRTQQSLFTRVSSMIHACVASSISPEVTHVITGAVQEQKIKNDDSKKVKTNKVRKSKNNNLIQADNVSNQAVCPRTLKFLSAVLQVSFLSY